MHSLLNLLLTEKVISPWPSQVLDAIVVQQRQQRKVGFDALQEVDTAELMYDSDDLALAAAAQEYIANSVGYIFSVGLHAFGHDAQNDCIKMLLEFFFCRDFASLNEEEVRLRSSPIFGYTQKIIVEFLISLYYVGYPLEHQRELGMDALWVDHFCTPYYFKVGKPFDEIQFKENDHGVLRLSAEQWKIFQMDYQRTIAKAIGLVVGNAMAPLEMMEQFYAYMIERKVSKRTANVAMLLFSQLYVDDVNYGIASHIIEKITPAINEAMGELPLVLKYNLPMIGGWGNASDLSSELLDSGIENLYRGSLREPTLRVNERREIVFSFGIDLFFGREIPIQAFAANYFSPEITLECQVVVGRVRRFVGESVPVRISCQVRPWSLIAKEAIYASPSFVNQQPKDSSVIPLRVLKIKKRGSAIGVDSRRCSLRHIEKMPVQLVIDHSAAGKQVGARAQNDEQNCESATASEPLQILSRFETPLVIKDDWDPKLQQVVANIEEPKDIEVKAEGASQPVCDSIGSIGNVFAQFAVDANSRHGSARASLDMNGNGLRANMSRSESITVAMTGWFVGRDMLAGDQASYGIGLSRLSVLPAAITSLNQVVSDRADWSFAKTPIDGVGDVFNASQLAYAIEQNFVSYSSSEQSVARARCYPNPNLRIIPTRNEGFGVAPLSGSSRKSISWEKQRSDVVGAQQRGGLFNAPPGSCDEEMRQVYCDQVVRRMSGMMPAFSPKAVSFFSAATMQSSVADSMIVRPTPLADVGQIRGKAVYSQAHMHSTAAPSSDLSLSAEEVGVVRQECFSERSALRLQPGQLLKSQKRPSEPNVLRSTLFADGQGKAAKRRKTIGRVDMVEVHHTSAASSPTH